MTLLLFVCLSFVLFIIIFAVVRLRCKNGLTFAKEKKRKEIILIHILFVCFVKNIARRVRLYGDEDTTTTTTTGRRTKDEGRR